MAFRIIRKNSISNGFTSSNVMEIMIDGLNDIPNLPVECDPGSIAFTADGTVLARLNLHGTWTFAKTNSVSSAICGLAICGNTICGQE